MLVPPARRGELVDQVAGGSPHLTHEVQDISGRREREEADLDKQIKEMDDISINNDTKIVPPSLPFKIYSSHYLCYSCFSCVEFKG